MAEVQYPRLSYRFAVRIDEIKQAGFQEVTIPDSSQEPIEYRNGNDRSNWTMKQPGIVKFGAVTLKWGVTDSTELYEWRKLVERGEISKARRNCAIALLDEMGDDDVVVWELTGAWPSKYEAPSLNSTSTDVAIETLELQVERLERVK